MQKMLMVIFKIRVKSLTKCFQGKEVLVWSINNYIGLSNHEEVRRADVQASKDWGLGYPMGSRMMSGNTNYHEQLENELSSFEKKKILYYNFGYQGIMSSIDALVDRKDVIVYDSECHACIIDGVRLHQGKRFVFLITILKISKSNYKELKRLLMKQMAEY